MTDTITRKPYGQTVIRDINVARAAYHKFAATEGRDSPPHVLQRASQPHLELIKRAGILFGHFNGWRLQGAAAHSFRIEDIGKRRPRSNSDCGTDMFDHCIFYRANGKCVAIVAQPYSRRSPGPDETNNFALELAADNRVAVHIPPHPLASFHYPGWTRFIVYTMLEHEIVWLPEQLHGIAPE